MAIGIINAHEFMAVINDSIKQAQEDAIKSLLDKIDIDDEIRDSVRAELVSRITYGMNLKHLEIERDLRTQKETLFFRVEL